MVDLVDVQDGTPDVALGRDEFARRYRERFYDPAFEPLSAEIDRIVEVAWQAYSESRKSPRTRPAGPGFADPGYQLSDEWRAARDAIAGAERRQRDPASPPRILLIDGSPRSDQTCPGEMSKTYRLAMLSRQTLEAAGMTVEFLDLSRLTSEYGRNIHPCKGCVSTAMPLCHWPCSCYPNHSLGQVQDWMADIYPMWAAAHGIMIITPVHWYQAPSALKLMIDRLVCADGGNPDPSSTHGKKVAEAKALEPGWTFPRHLAGRQFAVVAHGDAAGVETLTRILADWMTDMGLLRAGPKSVLGRYIGYYQPYADSHRELDDDHAVQEEVRNAALTLAEAVTLMRAGRLQVPGDSLVDPRPK